MPHRAMTSPTPRAPPRGNCGRRSIASDQRFDKRVFETRRCVLAAAGSLGAALLAGGLDSCGRTEPGARGVGASGAGQSSAAILLRGNGPDPDSLDPQKARTVEAQNILRDVFECLTSVARDGGVEPGAATAWSVSPDGHTYSFRLRQNGYLACVGPLVLSAGGVARSSQKWDTNPAAQYAPALLL